MKYTITEYDLGTVLTLADGRRYAFLEPKQRVVNLAEAVPWFTSSRNTNAPAANATCTGTTQKNAACASRAGTTRYSKNGQ